MAKTARFEYRGSERKVEEVVRRSKQTSGAYDSYLLSEITMFKPREGESAIRILPPTWEDTKKYGTGWELQIYLHRNVGPDNGTYLCLDKMLGQTCPICEARRMGDEDEADALKLSLRDLCYMIDRDNEKAGPQAWPMPHSVAKEINARSVDKKSNSVILIDDPEEGFDIIFNREGSDKRTKYGSIEVDRDPTPIHNKESRQKEWLAYVQDHPLPEILQFYDAEHIEKVLAGQVERRSRDEDEEDRGSRRSRRGSEDDDGDRRSSRRSSPRSDDGDEEEDRSSRRRGRSKDQDDEPEERSSRRSSRSQEDDEDKEERRPTRRRLQEPADDEEEPESRSRSRRGSAEDDEPEERSSRRSSRKDEGDDEEETEERSARRGRSDDDGEENGEEGDGEEPSRTARRSLDRLRNRRK